MTRFRPTAPNRPASFDAAVMAYAPGLRNLSKRLTTPDKRDDLVTDTIITALHRWASFREDGGMWNWLSLTMRATAQDGRKRAARSIDVVDDPEGHHLSRVPMHPRQEDYVELSQALARVSGRERDVLVRRVMGDTCREIANDNGLSVQRVQQIELKARERVRGGA